MEVGGGGGEGDYYSYRYTYMRLATAPGPTVHWLFRSHDLPTKYRSIRCSSVAHVLHV